jgi:hypothetical protein
MADQRAIVACSREDTMPLDAQALRQGCPGAHLVTGRHFCRSELDRFRELVAAGTH